jgi:mRNA interferase YafO
MVVRVFAHQIFKDACGPELFPILVEKFKKYKSDGIRDSSFGRDVRFDRPVAIINDEVWHIHIKDKTSKNWDGLHMRQFNMTSDTALIYCPGFWNANNYLLISFIVDAHKYYGGSEKFVRTWAAIASKFREKY